MKKLLAFLTSAALLLSLSGCGSLNTGASATNSELSKAIEILSGANSFVYTVYTEVQANNGDQRFVRNDQSEVKGIVEPMIAWGKTQSDTVRAGKDRVSSVIETYQKADGKKYEFYVRYSGEEGGAEQEPTISDWEKSSTSDPEQIKILTKFSKDLRDAKFYLIKANLDSFQLTEETKTGIDGLLRYDGAIDPATAIEAYRTYLRDGYVQFNMVKKLENPSLDELKEEITSGEVVDLQSGIPLYAYAEEPVPVSLWIDKNTYELKKAEIDKTSLMQAYYNKALPEEAPIVLKYLERYVIDGINTITEIERPE